MSLALDHVRKACKDISRQVMDNVGRLHIQYIVHHEGQKIEALSVANHEFASHPASNAALRLISKPQNAGAAHILGTAVAEKRMLWGLSKQEDFLTLCTINIDRFHKISEIQREAYHLAWHAMDTVKYSHLSMRKNENRNTLIIRKRNAMEMAQANLNADTFSALICNLQGDKSVIPELGLKRSLDTFSNIAQQRNELFPFPLVMETTDFSVSQWRYKTLPPRKAFSMAEKIRQNIMQTIDKEAVRNWLIFSESAQDMAWRGFTQENIIGAALNTSENTHVRSIAYLISDITKIKPSPILEVRNKYSAYCDEHFNNEIHYNMMRQTFKDVISKSMEINSHTPFIEAANLQNINLTQGQTIGWCAAALQDSARTFEQALSNGSDAESLTQQNFDKRKEKTSWESLRQIGKEIVEKQRSGENVTLKDLKTICIGQSEFSDIAHSANLTIKDPGYQNKMALNNELNIIPAGIKGPSIEAAPTMAATPQTPAPVAPAPPGMGGMGGGQTRQSPPLVTPTEKTKDSAKDEQTDRQ